MSQANLDQLNQLLSSNLGSDVQQSTIQQIRTAFIALNDADQTQMLQSLGQQVGQDVGGNAILSHGSMGLLGGGNQITEANLKDLLTTVTANTGGTTAGSVATNSGAYTSNTPPVSGPTQVGAPYVPGTDYPNALSYTDATDTASLAAMAGLDEATFAKQYADYQKNATTVRQTWTGHGALAEDRPPDQLNQQQFAQMSAAAMQGQWQPALDALDYEWNAQYGERMPAALRQQLLTALNGMDKEQQQAVLSAEMTYVQGLKTASSTTGTGVGLNIASLTSTLTSAIPQYIGTITTQYAQANPNIPAAQATEIAARKQGYIQWLTDRHIPVTADLLNQLVAMPLGTATSPEPGTDYAYLEAMPSDIKGLSWGEKDIAMGNLSSQWKSTFSREPNKQELLWSIGKTPDQINAFVDNSPSAIPGVTIGRYRDYTNFISSLGTSGASSTTHAFSGALDDSLIKDLHQQVTAASTGQAHPGAM